MRRPLKPFVTGADATQQSVADALAAAFRAVRIEDRGIQHDRKFKELTKKIKEGRAKTEKIDWPAVLAEANEKRMSKSQLARDLKVSISAVSHQARRHNVRWWNQDMIDTIHGKSLGPILQGEA